MKIEVLRATLQDKPILRNLMELYQYDFSEIEGEDVGNFGLFGYNYLDHYWTEPGRYPFLVKVDGKLAGFVLVSQHSYFSQDDDTRVISEFFIMRKYREQGIGEEVAIYIFELFPGKWEIGETAKNMGAQAFWRKVINRYTGGQFKEVFLNDNRWNGLVQCFDNSNRARRKDN